MRGGDGDNFLGVNKNGHLLGLQILMMMEYHYETMHIHSIIVEAMELCL